MPGENFGNSWGQYPDADAEEWQRIVREFENEHPNWREGQDDVKETETVVTPVVEEVKTVETVATQPEEVESGETDGLNGATEQTGVAGLDETSRGDVAAQPEQREMTLDERLAAENQERLKQSAAEMAEFERKMQLSPAEYWQDLRGRYAAEGVDLGLMPDVKGLQETARDFFWGDNGNGKQTERIEVAVRTELEKMAQAKADEIRRWQNEGRGLPITYENEWLEQGQRDIVSTLNSYYGNEGRFSGQAGGKLSANEEVAWQMAALPQRPGELSATWVFQTNPWMFEDETMVEYYNRLKNYRRQDMMRDWQVKQDEGKKLKTDAEVEELRGEEGEAGEGDGVQAEKIEPVVEAEVVFDGADETREARVEDEDEERVVRRKRGLKGAIGRLLKRFGDSMKLKYTAEDEAEDAAFVAEMERQEELAAQKEAEKEEAIEVAEAVSEEGETEEDREERWKETLREKLENLQKMTAEDAEGLEEYVAKAEKWLQGDNLSSEKREKLEASRDEALMYLWGYSELEKERQEKAAESAEASTAELAQAETAPGDTAEQRWKVDMEKVKQLTPMEVDKMMLHVVRARRKLEEKNLDEKARQKYEEVLDETTAYLDVYQQLQEEKKRVGEEEFRRKEEQAAGEYALGKLKEQKLISGEFGEKGYQELVALKADAEMRLIDAVWNEDREKTDMYEERLHFIKRALPLMIASGGQAA